VARNDEGIVTSKGGLKCLKKTFYGEMNALNLFFDLKSMIKYSTTSYQQMWDSED